MSVSALLSDEGLCRVKMAADGNCFFNAILHLTDKKPYKSMTALRRAAAEELRRAQDSYLPFFVFDKDKEAEYAKATRALERSRMWNAQVIDIAITVVASLIGANLVIYNVTAGGIDKFEVEVEGAAKTYHLLRTNDNHFDALEA